MDKEPNNFQRDFLYKTINTFPLASGITDLKGNILKINKKFIKIFGYKLEEIPILSKWLQKVCSNTIDYKIIKNIWENEVQKTTNNKKNKTKFFSLINKNRIKFQVEIDFKLIDNLILIFLNNIIEKIEEEFLKNSKNFLNSILDESPHPIWITDNKGTLIKINQNCCNILNITPDEVIGKYNILKDNIIRNKGFIPLVKQVFEKDKAVRFEIKYDTSKLEIGIGDLAFYSMLTSSALVQTNNLIVMILTAFATIVGTGITISGLKRNKILPGLPISIFLGIGTMMLSWYLFSTFFF